MTDAIAAREQRVRRVLARNDYRLHKTPARSWLRHYYEPGFMVTQDNTAVLGCGANPYEATIEEVEEWASELR